MRMQLTLRGQTFHFDSGKGCDLSIRTDFNGPQPSLFGVEPASATAYEGEGFVGDTRRGGSCNFERVSLVPHCNGTHTEGVGHISNERIFVADQLKAELIPAQVISVEPVPAQETEDSYKPEKKMEDRMISRAALEEALSMKKEFPFEALIIRTLPNPKKKRFQDYNQINAPYFSLEAMQFLDDLGIEHLLVDLPSVDRSDDQGIMLAHRTFWRLTLGSHALNQETKIKRTITELIYVPEAIQDGAYLLNLQLAPWNSDAAPSRPVIYPLENH